MIGLECLHATAEISERSDVIRAFPKRSKSSCNFARSAKGLTTKRRKNSSKSGKTVQGIVQSVSESLSMKWNRRFRGLTMFVFNFGVGSLEQSVKLGRLVIFDFLGNSLL